MKYPKSHGTIVLAWDENKKLMYCRTFDWDESSTNDKEEALKAFEYVRAFKYWSMGAVASSNIAPNNSEDSQEEE